MDRIVAIVGGTGAEGSGLALRFARARLHVRIGSRNEEKAQAVAREITAKAGSNQVTGHLNPVAVNQASIVVLTVPLSAQIETIKSIRGSFVSGAILVDATVPLEISIGGRLSRIVSLWDGSAAQQAARLAPPNVPVVAAFHSLSAEALGRIDQPIECDTLICGDDVQAKSAVSELAEMIPGVRAVDVGSIDSARYLESCAALLIALNLRHKVKHSGMRFTGLESGKSHG